MIAIAVKSPSDREAEIARQLGLYLEGGAQEVWWVRPAERTVAIHRLDDPLELLRSGDTLTTDALPGFALPLAAVFCFAARD
jgi:Uma2 family endonuclease